MKNKTIFDAVNEFKGEVLLSGVEHLVCNQSSGSIRIWYHDGFESLATPEWYPLCSIEEFNALVDAMKTNFGKCAYSDLYINGVKTPSEPVRNIDWDNAPEGATHYYKGTGDFCNFAGVWRGVVFYSFDEPMNIDLVCYAKRPTQSPVYTQEMADNGVLPSVGMECLAKSSIGTDLAEWSKGKIKYKSLQITVFEVDGCIEICCNALLGNDLAFKPLNPPVPLIDGECYQFNSPSGGLFKGYYIPIKGLFVAHKGSFDARLCTNIQPLTLAGE